MYRAVDSEGNTIDFMLSPNRDLTAARIAASLRFRSAEGAVQTVAGYEAMHAIRKGQLRWLPKGDVVGQVQFIQRILGIAA